EVPRLGECMTEVPHEIGPRHRVQEAVPRDSWLECFDVLAVQFPGYACSLVDEGAECPTIRADCNIIVLEEVVELESVVLLEQSFEKFAGNLELHRMLKQARDFPAAGDLQYVKAKFGL